ncbi:MAG: PAS domain S-box protein [Acidimicrobiales bacterium]
MHTDDRTATYGAAQPEIDEAVRLVLLERGPELVIALDDDLRIVYANPSALEELGYGPEDILGTSVLDFIHPDDIAYAARSIDNRRRHTGETGLTIQLRGRDARGAWRVADVVGRRLEIEGAPPLTVISMRPIDNTPALGSDPSRLRSVIDKTADVILLLAADGTVLFANMTVTRRLGHDRDVLVTRPWLDLVHPDDRGEAAERLTALVEGDDREAEWRVRLVDMAGATVVHALRLVDQHDDPLVAGVIVTATEVTALVEMEAKLRRQNELLAYEATHDHVTGLVNRRVPPARQRDGRAPQRRRRRAVLRPRRLQAGQRPLRPRRR